MYSTGRKYRSFIGQVSAQYTPQEKKICTVHHLVFQEADKYTLPELSSYSYPTELKQSCNTTATTTSLTTNNNR